MKHTSETCRLYSSSEKRPIAQQQIKKNNNIAQLKRLTAATGATHSSICASQMGDTAY